MTDSNQPNKTHNIFGFNNNPNASPFGTAGAFGSNLGNLNQDKTNSKFTFGMQSNLSTNSSNLTNDKKETVPSEGLNPGSNNNSTIPSGTNNLNQNSNGLSNNPFSKTSGNLTTLNNPLFGTKQNTTVSDSNTQKPLAAEEANNKSTLGVLGANNPFTLLNNSNPLTNPNTGTSNPPNPTENKTSFLGIATNQIQNPNNEKQAQPSNTINSTNSIFGNSEKSNGLEANKTNPSSNLLGNQAASSLNLTKGFSFGLNQNANAGNAAGNTNTTDKSTEVTSNNSNTVNATQKTTTGFGGFFGGKTLTEPPKTDNTTSAVGATNLFSKPAEQQKPSEPDKVGLFSGGNQENTQKIGFSFTNIQDKGISTNQKNPLSKPSTESSANQTLNTNENKPSGGNFLKTDLTNNLTANTNTINKDSSPKPKISFGFDAKPTDNTINTISSTSIKDQITGTKTGFSFGAKPSENAATTKQNDSASIFNKELPKTENTSETQTNIKTIFGPGNAKKESTDNTPGINKPATSQNPSDFFSSKPKTEANKIEKKPESKEAVKQEEGVKLSDPKEMPKISNSLEEVAINAMMKKSIEEIINHWKNELDNQVDRFDSSADKLKNFEFMFRKHFETICSLYELINNLKEDGNTTLRNLKDISLEEDQIIEQLNIMEKSLDQYLEIADNRQPLTGRSQFDGRDQIYLTATEIAKTVEEIQKDIDEVNSKISQGNAFNKEDNLNVLSYENPLLRESISMDKNEFTNILNSYYASLRSIQFMEQSLASKIMQAEVELNDIRRERERDKF